MIAAVLAGIAIFWVVYRVLRGPRREEIDVVVVLEDGRRIRPGRFDVAWNDESGRRVAPPEDR
jgi:hypothetical protein